MTATAVIFDMDGVIVNSEHYWHTEARDIFATAIADDIDVDEAFEHVTGMYIRDSYDALAETYEMAVTREEFMQMYFDRAETVYTEKVVMMDGFDTILSQIHDTGVTVAIASSSPKQWIEWVVDRFDIREAFATLVSAEDIDGRSKPAPDIYEHAAGKIDTDPADCLVVEDSHNGAKAAKAAGMTCIGYRTADNPDQDLSIADVVVAGPDELAAALQQRTEE